MPDPVRLLVDINYAAKVWFTLFLLIAVALVCSVASQLIPHNSTVIKYVVVDSRGVTMEGHDLALGEATNVQYRAAEDATMALLDRRPNDFDHPELLAELFMPAALRKAQLEIERLRGRPIGEHVVLRTARLGLRHGLAQLLARGAALAGDFLDQSGHFLRCFLANHLQ